MPQLTVDIPVHKIAEITKAMNTQEIETLSLLLTKEGKELIKRKQDLDLKKVQFLTRDEIFDV